MTKPILIDSLQRMNGQVQKRLKIPSSGWIRVWAIFLTFLITVPVFPQHIPVTFPLLQDHLRRKQLDGSLPLQYSLLQLPLSWKTIQESYRGSDSLSQITFGRPLLKENKHFQFQVLPIQLSQNFNSSHPYGWGEGPFLPAKGFQHFLEGGFQVSLGPLSLQLYPQVFHARNLPFQEYNPELPALFFQRISNFIGRLDIPVRHGTDKIQRVLPGNSHFKVNFGAFSAGISTENLWWGPGKQQALLISDNAEGFLHGTVHTRKPAKTAIGYFGGQYFMGKLENSNLPYYSDGSFDRYREYPDDWRYFTGITLNYSPKWIEGLSVGFARTFLMYHRKLEEDGWRAWFPIFEGLQKDQVGLNTSRFRETDQHLSVFYRWVWPQAHMEMYGEYIRTDHALNWRELILNPEHARGYTLGFSKLVPLAKGGHVYLQLEMTQTENSINNLVKYEGSITNQNHGGLGLYENFQVLHGLSHRGQVLGSGLGHSGNSARITLSKVKDLNQFGFSIERIKRDANFYNFNRANGLDLLQWVDLSLGTHWDHQFDHLLFSATARLIQSHNYNYAIRQTSSLGNSGYKKSNFHSRLKMAYLF